MAATPSGSNPGPQPAQGRSDALGIALIVGAVLIGLLFLVKGYDAESGVVAQDDKASSQSTTTTTAPVEQTTTTTLLTNPPAQVQVKVANASGTPSNGLASKTRTTLQGKGYTQISITDAPSAVTATQVLYVAGSEGDAQAVAAALGLPATAVQPMTNPAPVTLGSSTVLVLAGPDLA
jgi:hypothetical protein